MSHVNLLAGPELISHSRVGTGLTFPPSLLNSCAKWCVCFPDGSCVSLYEWLMCEYPCELAAVHRDNLWPPPLCVFQRSYTVIVEAWDRDNGTHGSGKDPNTPWKPSRTLSCARVPLSPSGLPVMTLICAADKLHVISEEIAPCDHVSLCHSVPAVMIGISCQNVNKSWPTNVVWLFDQEGPDCAWIGVIWCIVNNRHSRAARQDVLLSKRGGNGTDFQTACPGSEPEHSQ